VRIRKKIEICGIVGILDWNRAIKHGILAIFQRQIANAGHSVAVIYSEFN
jgi:hypothetical protein